jgi:hypothetical protein
MIKKLKIHQLISSIIFNLVSSIATGCDVIATVAVKSDEKTRLRPQGQRVLIITE